MVRGSVLMSLRPSSSGLHPSVPQDKALSSLSHPVLSTYLLRALWTAWLSPAFPFSCSLFCPCLHRVCPQLLPGSASWAFSLWLHAPEFQVRSASLAPLPHSAGMGYRGAREAADSTYPCPPSSFPARLLASHPSRLSPLFLGYLSSSSSFPNHVPYSNSFSFQTKAHCDSLIRNLC